jgi:Tol biopolymer transport system component
VVPERKANRLRPWRPHLHDQQKGQEARAPHQGKKYNGDKFRDLSPSWSSEGDQIVFAREYHQHADFRSDLFVVDSDGSHLRPIETQGIAEFDPVWSPDGESIAFWAARAVPGFGEEFEIYLMRPDGSEVQLVVGMLDQTSELGDWAPDGQLLAFSNKTPGVGPEIYTVRPDGSQQTRLTDESKPSHGPAFSPSGDRIAFSAGGVLKLMGSDGGNVMRLMKKSDGRDFAPSWQPR